MQKSMQNFLHDSSHSNADGPVMLNASVSGPVVCLDNWAIYDLAEDDPHRRKRFIDAMPATFDSIDSRSFHGYWTEGRKSEAVQDLYQA